MEPTSLQEAILYFASHVNCREYMVARRWPDGVTCPRCGSKNVLFLEKYNRWHCKEKHKAPQFTLKTGTIFEDSPIALSKWLTAMWMVVNCKNGISSYEISRSLKLTQKSAWFVLHRCRLALQDETETKLGYTGGPVEIDETFVGGKLQYMHKSRRKEMKEAHGALYEEWRMNKTIVMGFLDRKERRVRATIIPSVRRDVLQNAILNEVSHCSRVYTDDAVGYQNMDATKYVHETVSHLEEYVRGKVHTQGIENFWSLLKRGLKGTYVAVEPFHLQRYVDEQVFRFNNRATKDNPLNDADRFDLAVRQIVGKRLTYAEVTGKTGESRPVNPSS